MNRILSAFPAGLTFGLGIAISGLGSPAKVLNFFDPFGTWNPRRAFVMDGALITAMLGYCVIFGTWTAPLFAAKFHLPTSTVIDAKLADRPFPDCDGLQGAARPQTA
jgi:hypothetical protein